MSLRQTRRTLKIKARQTGVTESTAALRFETGTNLVNPEVGTVEYDGINYYRVTTTGGITEQIRSGNSTEYGSFTTENYLRDIIGEITSRSETRDRDFVLYAGSRFREMYHRELQDQVRRYFSNNDQYINLKELTDEQIGEAPESIKLIYMGKETGEYIEPELLEQAKKQFPNYFINDIRF